MENRGHRKLKEEALDRTLWKLALEEAMDLAYEWIRSEWMNEYKFRFVNHHYCFLEVGLTVW